MFASMLSRIPPGEKEPLPLFARMCVSGVVATVISVAASVAALVAAATGDETEAAEGGVRWRVGAGGLAEQHHRYERERARTAGAPYRAAAEQLLLEKKFGLEHAGDDVLEDGMRGTASRPSATEKATAHRWGAPAMSPLPSPSPSPAPMTAPR